MYSLGIDLGGTNIATAVVNENYEILGRGKIKTRAPRPAEEICRDMYQASLDALDEAGLTLQEVHSIGLGCPGTINRETGIVEFSNNLAWSNEPVQAMLEELFGRKVYMENDANAAAYGEFLAGAGRGSNNFVAITLGTGVGGGVIVDGKLLCGSNFAGAELGHTVIQMNGAPCSWTRSMALPLLTPGVPGMKPGPAWWSSMWNMWPAASPISSIFSSLTCFA